MDETISKRVKPIDHVMHSLGYHKLDLRPDKMFPGLHYSYCELCKHKIHHGNPIYTGKTYFREF